MFPIKKTISVDCPKCAKAQQHEKIGTNFDLHVLVMFFSCFLWTPVLIIAAIWDKSKLFRCTGCGSPYRGPIPKVSSAPK